MTVPLYSLPDPPDLDLGEPPVDPDVPLEVAALADAYGCSVADMVRWIVEDDGPEGVDLDLAVREGARRHAAPGEDPEQAADDAAQLNREMRAETIGWRITSADLAEWALGKLNEARAQAHVVHRQADDFAAPHRERLARVEQWREDALRKPLADVAFFRAHLERFGRLVREATGEATVTLPAGSIETRTVPAAAVVADQDALVQELFAEHGWTDDGDFEVKRTVPARRLNSRVQLGYEYVVELSCGHRLNVGDTGPALSDTGVEDQGCPHCAESAEDLARLEWPLRAVVAVEVTPAVWLDGRTLRHAHVRPERLSITVRTDVLPPPGEPAR